MVERSFYARNRDSLVVLGQLALGAVVAVSFIWVLLLGRYEPPMAPLFNWITVGLAGVWLLTLAMGGARRNGAPKQRRGTGAWWAAIANSVVSAALIATACLPRSITFALDGDWVRSAIAILLCLGMATWVALSIRRFVREDQIPA